ncbi:vWA domain-containing protein [Phytohabitans sp. LJ34]|uniref:vWA domain-containing protein n=1 Tax=Phytohabitans sp. LJ34 TaxID=3452217 RepID=UPI003F8C0332
MPKKRKAPVDPNVAAFQAAWRALGVHPMFAPMLDIPMVGWRRRGAEAILVDDPRLRDAKTIARVDRSGRITAGKAHRLDEGGWTWVLAHCLLHLGFGHLAPDRYAADPTYADVACLAVTRFQRAVKLGTEPLPLPAELPTADETVLLRQWREAGVPPHLAGCGPGGTGSDLVPEVPPDTSRELSTVDWPEHFALGLAAAATAAVEVAGGVRSTLTGEAARRKPWDLARSWFLSSFPLLGALASRFTLVADADLARRWDIAVAAVSPAAGEIYLNPLRQLSGPEWRFVLAHEMLHAALRHGDRAGPRDPYLWNVAADYVINGWLVEMGVGEPPDGLLHDPDLAGLSAEAVYDRIATDLRRLRKLGTLRGTGLGDVLGEPLPWSGCAGRGVDLDDFYRRALLDGYTYHQRAGRGLLPAGLEEEIRVLDHPPLPWDARLARWFDEYVPSPLRVRSYARPSRRQASTPGIPRPGWRWPDEAVPRCTFGVVLDTSGSMDRELLGKALGAIASYATARDVPAARVVFCDAYPYDAGYLPPEQIAGRVRVRGRGGTVLQPGVHLLERAADFPPTAPILLITDGYCDAVRIRREHAFLVPEAARLPFTPRGPVFRLR